MDNLTLDGDSNYVRSGLLKYSEDGSRETVEESSQLAKQTLDNFTSLNSINTSCAIDIDSIPELRLYVTSFLILFCIISFISNVVILSSTFFFKGNKWNPTLFLNLSLSAADTLSLLLFAMGLVFFTLIPEQLCYYTFSDCVRIMLEGVRMGAMLTTMLHLLALAGHHYLGTFWALRSKRLATRGRLRALALLLWTLPTSLLAAKIYYWHDCQFAFLTKWRYRLSFTIPFFLTITLMVFIYCHILIFVKLRERKPWRRAVSIGRALHPRRPNAQHRGQNWKMERTTLTTLMILGSTLVGWLPCVTYFLLVCEDCPLKEYFKLNTLAEYLFLAFINFLMISKPAVNIYIYVYRMPEFKKGLGEMKRRVTSLARGDASASAEAKLDSQSVCLGEFNRRLVCETTDAEFV